MGVSAHSTRNVRSWAEWAPAALDLPPVSLLAAATSCGGVVRSNGVIVERIAAQRSSLKNVKKTSEST